ncbi:MAG TPA: hypothetical protein VNI02_25330 [Blastocatellia bacterium]|nr:hypothetical protein [Blastocatellia bacterium]
MSKQTDRTFFINPPLVKAAEFYQHLSQGIRNYENLGNRIVGKIKAAHAFRQVDIVRELSSILINLPIREYQLIGQYYLAWCDCRESKFNNVVLETVIEQTRTYTTKALLSRAAIEGYQGKTEPELYFYNEALKTSSTISDYVEASRCIAIVKSKEGFHTSALKDLENLVPIIKHAVPLVHYDFLNSYSVELGEAGRAYEARNASSLVLASPFIHAYPEWQETARGLREPSHSFVTVPSIEREPVEIEANETRHASKEVKPNRPGRVVSFPPLKEAPKPTKPNRVTPEEFGEMTADERAELVLATIRSGDVKESDYVKLVIALGLLDGGPASKVIDLEDEALLDDIIILWCNMIEPEEFASVMSAIRDCEDDLRRGNIIDSMIGVAFKQTPASMQTEQEWRLRVERKLPER